jgi:hypothetical protein
MYAFDQYYALACVCRIIFRCKMYSYLAPSRPVFYVLLCIDVLLYHCLLDWVPVPKSRRI